MQFFAHHTPRSRRILIALSIGLIVGILCGFLHPDLEGNLADLGWPFNAARDLLAQRDPYRHAVSIQLIPYPLTAAILVFPWALLPGNLGLIALFGGTSALLAYGLIRDGDYWRLLVFLSPSYLTAIKFMQWSPLFMAVFFFPILAPMLLAKPTLAIPVALSIRWTSARLLSVLSVGLISLLVMPTWPWRWLSQVGGYGGFIPMLSLLAPLFLLAALFWRNAQARLFLLLTLTPQHLFFYDQLLLWMLPQTRNQMLLLTLTSWAAFLYMILAETLTFWDSAPYILTLMYLPALLIVLWQQPAVQQRWRTISPKLRRKAS
jgi:hypothetical protein